MQGRLSPIVDQKIQSFPWLNWQAEFSEASSLDLHHMEWTLDYDRIYKNPLLTAGGQSEIRKLSTLFNIKIPSLTGDCFMQRPFWKYSGAVLNELQNDFLAILHACASVNITLIVVPLVDNGCIDNDLQMNTLATFLLESIPILYSNNQRIVFESDFEPERLLGLIELFPDDLFGINYDIGNSASLGFDPLDEFNLYGNRIYNVHIKDRPLNSTTVPLGEGDAKFADVFNALNKINYKGNFILQTARSKCNQHSDELRSSMNFLRNILGDL